MKRPVTLVLVASLLASASALPPAIRTRPVNVRRKSRRRIPATTAAQNESGQDNRGHDNRGNDNRGHDNRGNDHRGHDNRGNTQRNNNQRDREHHAPPIVGHR